MKILYVTTLKRDMVKVWLCQETSFFGSLIPPVDLVSIATTLSQDGHLARVLDLRLYKKPLDVYKMFLKEFKPDALVLNLATASAVYDYEIVKVTPREVKKIAFGSHAIALPEEAFQNGFDYVLYGDPEKALRDLVNNNLNAQGIDGISIPYNINRTPNLFEDLDSIPYLDLSMIELNRYSAVYVDRGRLFTAMLSSRGCPFRCTYCLNPTFFSRRYRTQSPERIAEELKFLNRRFGIEEVLFLDATFNISELQVIKFCEELLKRNIKINWLCNMRVEPVNLEMLKLMKEAGCKRVMYGVEDVALLEDIKKDTTSQKIFDAFTNSRKAGLAADAYVILFPDTKHLNEVSYAKYILNLLKQLNADAFQCNIAIPFPGTELFKSLSKEGSLKSDWALYDPGGKKMPYCSKLDLGKVKRIIFIRYPFMNLKNILNLLKDIDLKSLKKMLKKYLENLMQA
ncbi:MAG: radical SAM protein [Candidatus Omnitrophota bacterium]|nr:radical SAM protein [Candidatus Omnitrophota bacterium]